VVVLPISTNLLQSLGKMNLSTSTYVMRPKLRAEPASIDKSDTIDKGATNLRAVLRNDPALAERLNGMQLPVYIFAIWENEQ
jgi:hypothetical protein